MLRAATLIAAVVLATPASAQFNVLSPTPIAGENWVGVSSSEPKPHQVAYQAAPTAAPPTEMARKGPRLSSLPALAEPEQPTGGPTLKREVTIVGQIVRIGDLIENAGAVVDVPIFRAPDLGQTGSVPARRIAEVVRPHQIVGLDTRGIEHVTVTRASRAISGKEIEARLVRALADQHALADANGLAIAFDHEPRTLHVEPNATADLTVARLSYDARSRRFDATLELSDGSAGRHGSLRLTGALQETFDAAVPLRVLAQGEAVKASDVAIERRPKGEFVPGVLTSVEQIAGLVAKRPLQPGKIIRQSDVMKRELVARNETVTIVFEAPGITLTVRGKALESGAQGDLVNVLNVQSKRTVQATVTGPSHVTVAAMTPRIIAKAEPSNP